MKQVTLKPARAFTLIELLVVVGIIALLVAVLFPVLGRAREQANRVKCAANMHSIGQALTMYTQRYGCYPSCFLAARGQSGIHYGLWPVRLREFTVGEQRIFNCPSQDERCEWKKEFSGPGDIALPVHVAYGYEPDERMLTVRSYFSYGYNLWGTEIGDDGPEGRGLGSLVDTFSPEAAAWSREVRASAVRVPSEMIAVTDATADGMWDVAVSPNHPNPGLWPGKLHGGGCNVLFCDGHVQWYQQKALLVAYRTIIPSEISARRMWNRDNGLKNSP